MQGAANFVTEFGMLQQPALSKCCRVRLWHSYRPMPHAQASGRALLVVAVAVIVIGVFAGLAVTVFIGLKQLHAEQFVDTKPISDLPGRKDLRAEKPKDHSKTRGQIRPPTRVLEVIPQSIFLEAPTVLEAPFAGRVPERFETRGVRRSLADLQQLCSPRFWESLLASRYHLVLDGTEPQNAPDVSRSLVFAGSWAIRAFANGALSATDRFAAGLVRADGNLSEAWLVSTIMESRDDRNTLTVFATRVTSPMSKLEVLNTGDLDDSLSFDYLVWPPDENQSQAFQRHVRSLADWCEQQRGPNIEGIIEVKDSSSAQSSYYFIKTNQAANVDPTPVIIVALGSAPPRSVTVSASDIHRPLVEWQLLQPPAAPGAASPAHRLHSIQWDLNTPSAARIYVLGILEAYLSSGVQDATVNARVPLTSDSFATVTFDLSEANEQGIVVEMLWQGVGGAIPTLAPRMLRLNPNDFAAEWSTLHPNTVTPGRMNYDKASEIMHSSLNAAWFEDNYGIFVLDSQAASEWMSDQTSESSQSDKGLESFIYEDLLALELSLQQIGRPAIDSLKGVRLVRKQQRVLPMRTSGLTGSLQSGLTLADDSKTTIIIYDAAYLNDATLWTGHSTPWPLQAWTIVHEFGHVLAQQRVSQLEFVSQFSQQAAKYTWYASSTAATEAFPEAFALYILETDWLRDRNPELVKWFDNQMSHEHLPQGMENP